MCQTFDQCNQGSAHVDQYNYTQKTQKIINLCSVLTPSAFWEQFSGISTAEYQIVTSSTQP